MDVSVCFRVISIEVLLRSSIVDQTVQAPSSTSAKITRNSEFIKLRLPKNCQQYNVTINDKKTLYAKTTLNYISVLHCRSGKVGVLKKSLATLCFLFVLTVIKGTRIII